MTRRHASPAGTSPRSFAASRTSQAVSTDDWSDPDPPERRPRSWRTSASRGAMFIFNLTPGRISTSVVSMRVKLGLPARPTARRLAALARFIEFHNGAGGLDVVGGEFSFEVR